MVENGARKILLLIALIFSAELFAKKKSYQPTFFFGESYKKSHHTSYDFYKKNYSHRVFRNPFKSMTTSRVSNYFHRWFSDSVEITKNIFSMNSIKVLAATTPLYLILRQTNRPVHNQFYVAETHKNKNRPSRFLRFLGDEAMGIVYGGLGFVGFFHQDEEVRHEFQLYMHGLGLVFLSKVLLKCLKIKDNIRPGNADYNKESVFFGGCPSGHTATLTYSTVFFGLSRGKKWAIPFGLYTGFTMTMLVANNTHYASQIAVGAGLGGIFGVAAHSVLKNIKKPDNLSFGLTTDSKGKLAVRVAYDF